MIVDQHADDRVSFDGFRKTTRDEAHWLLVNALGEVVGTDLPKETKS